MSIDTQRHDEMRNIVTLPTQNDIATTAILRLVTFVDRFADDEQGKIANDPDYFAGTVIRYFDESQGIMHLTLHTNDEGGPHELTVYFTPFVYPYNEGPDAWSGNLRMIVHEFDTSFTVLRCDTDNVNLEDVR